MNILYLSEPDPRMTHFGGAQRTNYIWRALQEVGDVYTMTFDQRFETEEVAPRLWYVKKLQRVNPLRDFFYKLQYKFLYPLQVLQCFPLATKIEKTADEIFPGIKFDVVVCRYLDVLGEMHLWGHPHLIVDIDDDPLQMFDTAKSRSMNPSLRHLGRWILKCQLRFLSRKVTLGWLSNASQVNACRIRVPLAALRNISAVPSVDYEPDATRKMQILSVGALDYAPNYLGIEAFLSEIWPTVHKAFPDLNYVIVGKNAPKEYAEKWKSAPNVIQMGFVDNLEQLYAESLCTVVSVGSGGGTCIKTIESLSYGRVCLSTPFGIRGHEEAVVSSDIGLYSFNDASHFVELLDRKVMDATERSRHEASARQYAEENFSFKAFADTVKQTVQNVVNQ